MWVLKDSDVIFSDGTFKTAPPPYVQLYTLHGVVRDRRIPLVFALLTSKNTQAYVRVLRIIDRFLRHNHQVHFTPQRIIVDFELGFINAVNAEIPAVTVGGCHFHFCKRLYKKVQDLGLQGAYGNDNDVKKFVLMMMALAFLPRNVVIVCYNNLRTTPAVFNINANLFITYPALAAFCQYIEATWLRGSYPIALWNVYRRANNERTSNVCEGWHHRFNRRVAIVHPNVWRFIIHLQKEEMHIRRAIRRSERGANPPPQKRKYVDLNNRIDNARQAYQNNLPLNLYWRQIRHVCHRF